ncbi:hypothetical protein DYI81_07725 [Acinetobacter sp. SWAC5]|uniref:glucosamine inositolphosphorylceramide transferase family protein n=1 Tax=Acinetobacter sp. SWAC5 TaxID=2293835 RepID=UPI000E356D8E|nr:hypothetical protein [Acinetobacter sp. SWAC5]RFS31795.1 hypothetical protein DYI81_07725 [Acinetobacter sp. SWAC5]
MMRTILKKWYKFQQKQHAKNFDSHWYMRFGWLNAPLKSQQQLNELFEIHSPRKFTFADCFYAQHNDRHFIFFEEVDDIHPVGFLSVLEIFKDGAYTEPQTILKLDYHLSYPCIFKIENDWYMIPETSANKTVELWKCTDFPLRWEKHSNLLEGIEAVDTTPFLHNGMWYLFTSTRRNCKKFGDRLDLFMTKDLLNPNWQEHPQNPVCKGLQQFRMAGKPFSYDGKLVRPSQDSLKRYGGNIELKHIVELSPTTYKEELLEVVLPDWNPQDDGCHTINAEGDFVVLDAIRLTAKK